jgi:hypothetical protein
MLIYILKYPAPRLDTKRPQVTVPFTMQTLLHSTRRYVSLEAYSVNLVSLFLANLSYRTVGGS